MRHSGHATERFTLRQPRTKFYIQREVPDTDFDPPVWVERERFGPFKDREAARRFMIERTGPDA